MRTRLATRVATIAVAVSLMAVLLAWMAGAFEDKVPPGEVAAPVERVPEGSATAEVEEAGIAVVEEATGTVQAERKTVVSSRIVAVLQEVRVRAGDQVEQGDTLVVLDDRELETRAREAERAVDAAEAAFASAESDFGRVRKLFREGVISASEFDRAESAFKIARAELERVRQALETARVSQTYTEIKSPVSGRVIERFAEPGDTTLPGRPLLAVYDPAALRIEVPLRESLLERVKVGAHLQVRLEAAGEELEGTVDEIVPQAEAGSRTFLVKVGLPKREGIYTGMFGRVLIPAGVRKRVTIPEQAVQTIGQLRFVEVVRQDRTRQRRLVTVGPATGDGRIEVLSGLRAGETVLLP